MTFRIAFYKGKGRLFDNLIRWWERGPYSHCELVFSDGATASSTVKNGVRITRRVMHENDWDFIELPAHLEIRARQWFTEHEGKAYDYLGDIRFIFDFLSASRDKWFCSRACADALGIKEAWRYGPNTLASALRSFVPAS
jgi:hypothetical protein